MVTYQTQEVVEDTGDTVHVTRRRVAPAPVPDEPPQVAYEKKKTIFRSYQIIWYIVGFIETLLAFRFLLRLLGANPRSGFADLIYSLSLPFISPFVNLFPTPGGGRFAIEFSTIMAMIVYFLIGYAVVKLLQMIKPTTPEEVERAVQI